jgi:hypothetical protein
MESRELHQHLVMEHQITRQFITIEEQHREVAHQQLGITHLDCTLHQELLRPRLMAHQLQRNCILLQETHLLLDWEANLQINYIFLLARPVPTEMEVNPQLGYIHRLVAQLEMDTVQPGETQQDYTFPQEKQILMGMVQSRLQDCMFLQEAHRLQVIQRSQQVNFIQLLVPQVLRDMGLNQHLDYIHLQEVQLGMVMAQLEATLSGCIPHQELQAHQETELLQLQN